MKVLVLGCSGFIGPAVVRSLCESGHEVIGMSRGRRSADLPAGAVHAVADRRNPGAVASVARVNRIDALIDLVAFTEPETRPLLRDLSGAIGRYVLVSSADVYRNYGGLHRRENPFPIPWPLDENSLLRSSRHPYRGDIPRPTDDPDRWLDDYDKIPIEATVRAQRAFTWTILRLPMVFGPGDRQRRFSRYIRRLAQGRRRAPLDSTLAGWRATFGYVEDVGAAIALAAVHPSAAGKTYNLGRPDAPTQAEWLGIFGAAMGRRAAAVPVRSWNAPEEQKRRFAGLDFRYPLVLDTGPIRSELGFSEVVNEQTALSRTIDDELSQPSWPGFAAELVAEDACLCAHAW